MKILDIELSDCLQFLQESTNSKIQEDKGPLVHFPIVYQGEAFEVLCQMLFACVSNRRFWNVCLHHRSN